MKIAVVQMSMVESCKANLQTCLLAMKEAKEAKADMVIFPEGALGLYVPQYEGLPKEEIGISLEDKDVHALCECAKTYNLIVSIGLCLERDKNIYATNVIISETGKILSITAKSHIVRARHFYNRITLQKAMKAFLLQKRSMARSAVLSALIVIFQNLIARSL